MFTSREARRNAAALLLLGGSVVAPLLWSAPSAGRRPAASRPATRPGARPKPAKAPQTRASAWRGATVVSVRGTAQRMAGSGGRARWVALGPGDVLGRRAVVRTGLGSRLEIVLPGCCRATIEGAAKIEIREFVHAAQGGSVLLRLQRGTVDLHRPRGRAGREIVVEMHVEAVRGGARRGRARPAQER
jgi:hypothetical protein